MSENLTALAYLIASVLFIMALRGLSSPESARQGNIYGIIGMAIAIVTTVIRPDVVSYSWILAGLVAGGPVGPSRSAGVGASKPNPGRLETTTLW